MGIKIKNLQTGEFEKFNIPALKGEKGEPGEIEPSEKVDYIGKQHSKLRDTMNANVDYIIKTAIGEFNYLDYEGQHITATNSIEGHAKSAILKGQTKLMDELGNECDHPNRPNAVIGAYISASTGEEVLENTSCRTTYIKAPHETFKIRGKNRWKKLAFYDVNKQLIKTLDPALNSYDDYVVNSTLIPSNAEYMRVSGSISPINSGDVVESVLEILDVNNSSLYNTQLRSCKMPILRNVGKNLLYALDGRAEYRGITLTSSNGKIIVNGTATSNAWVNLQPIFQAGTSPNIGETFLRFNNTTLTLSTNIIEGSLNGNQMSVTLWEKDGTGNRNLTTQVGKSVTQTITEPIEFKRLWVMFPEGTSYNNVVFTIQLEESSSTTTYEDYKTNILTVNEDVTLRGIGDVKDELDCLTGELTQCVGEVILNGQEEWRLCSSSYQPTDINYISYDLDVNNIKTSAPILCDTIKVRDWTISSTEINSRSIAVHSTTKILRLCIEKTIAPNVETLKTYLSTNMAKVQYQLATESVKTVDLSDNVVYSYKDTTHYTCSSEEGSLVPTLSVKVPTDTQLTIQEQKAATQTLLIKNMDLQQSIKEVQAMNLAFNTALYNSFNSIREEVEDIKKHVSTNENLEGSF